MVLVFKQIPRDEAGYRFIYVLDFLDMKFSISEHRISNRIKIYAGWRQDDGSYTNLDYRQAYNQWAYRKVEETSREKVNKEIENILKYIQSLYAFDSLEYVVHEHMNLIIEQWLAD